MIYCTTCGGRTDGLVGLGEHVCDCPRVSDPKLGISIRFLREYDIEADTRPPLSFHPDAFKLAVNGLGDADENDAQPLIKWELTLNDRRFLRSLRIGVD